MALHQVLAGYIAHNYYMPGTTTKLSMPSVSGVVVTLEIGLGLTVTEINIKKVEKQDLKKNIKNVKRCRDGMPKSMQTR